VRASVPSPPSPNDAGETKGERRGERAGVLCLRARSNNDDSNKADAGERNRTRRFRDDVRAERQAIRPKCKSLP
jgi:hypothetical protein